MSSGAPEVLAAPAPLVSPIVLFSRQCYIYIMCYKEEETAYSSNPPTDHNDCLQFGVVDSILEFIWVYITQNLGHILNSIASHFRFGIAYSKSIS